MPDTAPLESLEAVYYPQQVPSSLATLTLLAFIFDRIYFPAVYMPPEKGLDEQGLREEIQRIAALGRRDIDTVQLLDCMAFAGIVKHVRDFCIFTGEPGALFGLYDKAHEVARALDELVFGPPPENFIPTPVTGFVKALPGNDALGIQVNGPGWLYYPANALLFSAERQIPLINDDPRLPVPGIPGQTKGNAKLLSIILAIESVKMVLPKIKPLPPEALKDFRGETAAYVMTFRLAVLKMAKTLNSAITSEMTLAEVQKEARFLLETDVYPQLKELEAAMNDPVKPWYRRAVDLARKAPELAANFITLPKNLAVAKLLGETARVFADLRDEQLDKEHRLNRGGLHYLLKLKEYG